MNKARKYAILERLEEMYPDAKPELVFSNPYEMLVATMLSAQCTDKQVNKVTPAVFSRWPDADSMAGAEVEELFPLVKSCGFRSKAGNIIAACRMIRDEHGGKVPDTREALTALPGVGRKTANVVLSNAFGIPAFAVDTHVFRVSNRLGLCKADTVEETERQLNAADSPGKMGTGTSLADLARTEGMQGAASAVQRLRSEGSVPDSPKEYGINNRGRNVR
jgi:DNA-(apurinic or apyrimidinic site) lyase (EC 4.2.99.18)/endonuclease III (EC 3.2.2.-)